MQRSQYHQPQPSQWTPCGTPESRFLFASTPPTSRSIKIARPAQQSVQHDDNEVDYRDHVMFQRISMKRIANESSNLPSITACCLLPANLRHLVDPKLLISLANSGGFVENEENYQYDDDDYYYREEGIFEMDL